MKWIPLTAAAPKGRVLLGCWRDMNGADWPVLIEYDESNLDLNHGFIGTDGQRYGAGGITHYAEFVLPDGEIPEVA